MKKSDDKKPISEKPRSKSDKATESKSEIEASEKLKNTSLKPISDKNGMLCPKSVRNQLKRVKETSEKDDNKVESKDVFKIKPNENTNSTVVNKKPMLNMLDGKIVEIKINKDKINLFTEPVKSIKSEPSLSNSDNAVLSSSNHKTNESDQSIKRKKKKKHTKSKNLIDSDDGNKDVKNKKSRKSKKKKHKDISPENVSAKDEHRDLNVTKEAPTVDVKVHKAPMSLLVSYSSDEEESHNEQPHTKTTDIKISPEIKTEATVKEHVENKIEIKIKPTKSPGKSAWDSSDSELDNVAKEAIVPPAKSKSPSVVSKHSKKSKSSSKEKSETKSKSLSKSHSGSRSKSGSHSRSRSNSRSSKSRSGSSDSRSRSYSRSHSKSYSETSESRSRSYSRSRSRSKRKSRHHRRHSSSYSRSRSRYRSRSVSRSSSDSGSSRSYSRSRSRFKSSYSTRYRSRSRSRSSRSRSRNSYYRSSYRRHKRSSSPDNFLNPQNRKTKQILNRNSLLGGVPKPVDISKKIDAIKESQKKAAEAHSLSSLNIPLPPEKPKTTPIKPGPGEWCPSMDFGGPVAKKAKKTAGNKMTTVENKPGESSEINSVSENHLIDYNYIGPQVSSDMAKKLGLDVKATKKEKENSRKGVVEYSQGGETYLTTALDASHLALQSRAYQHRLNNLQGHANSDFGGQTAQYFQSLYMSPSSLTNNLTATALAAVASEQLPASVAGSLAQAAVQRIMSSSNLTATYNTPSVVATPTASYQTALQHTLPGSCSTLVASTPSGLVPISLLQQGGVSYGINQLVLQHLQQQALNAQLGQAIAIPNQSILGGINPLIFQQASNQQALLQSLGFGAQTQLLASPLNFQHTLLMAAQQQQQQMIAAAQLNQAATIQAAQLQAQIQAQARAASIQNLQQAAQMQSSAQQAAQMQSSAQNAAAAAAMAASAAMDQFYEQLPNKGETEQNINHQTSQIQISSGGGGCDESKQNVGGGDYQMVSEQQQQHQHHHQMVSEQQQHQYHHQMVSEQQQQHQHHHQMVSEQQQQHQHHHQMVSEQQQHHHHQMVLPTNSIINEANNLITSSTTELNQFEESAVNTTTVTSEPSSEAVFNSEPENESISNDISSSSSVIKQAPRIIYNSPAVMASLVTTPITKP